MSAAHTTGKSLGVGACTAIVVGNMVGSGFYLSPPALAPYGNLATPMLQGRLVATVLTVGSIWAVVLVNLRGVSVAGLFAEVTTYAKMIPFGAIAIIGLGYVDTSRFGEFNPSGQPLLSAAAALAPLTMFAFMGMESATVPAGDVRDPSRTIGRATVIGIAIAATLYILGTVVGMGVVPRAQLAASTARSPMPRA